jgi:hypothetical protein
MLELTLALHTLCTDPEHQCLCRHRALAQQPSCLGKKQTLPGDEYGSRGCCWAVVVSPSATDATTDTQRGHNRWYTQDNILQHCSSSKRQLRARLSPCQTAPRTALPMPSPKAKSHRQLGRVEMAQRVSWSVCPEAWRHYHPLPTSLSALLLCPPLLLYISRTHPRPARLPTALPIPHSGPIV